MSGKYHAVKVTEDGYTFDSKAERRRYRELKLLQQAGEIVDLRVHHRLPLIVEGVNCGYYESDFDYEHVPSRFGQREIEDVKGVRTPVYRLKKKLVRALYGLEITEVEA